MVSNYMPLEKPFGNNGFLMAQGKFGEAPSVSVGLLILQKAIPLFSSHSNWFLLANAKHLT